MIDSVLQHLLQVVLAEATSPEVRRWAFGQLKGLEEATTNVVLKAVLEAVEALLGASA